MKGEAATSCLGRSVGPIGKWVGLVGAGSGSLLLVNGGRRGEARRVGNWEE